MYTSNRIPHDSDLYHEHIFNGDRLVAQVLSEADGSYWWVRTKNGAISRGYRTVGDAKRVLFPILDALD